MLRERHNHSWMHAKDADRLHPDVVWSDHMRTYVSCWVCHDFTACQSVFVPLFETLRLSRGSYENICKISHEECFRISNEKPF